MEIKSFALQAAILDERQFGRKGEKYLTTLNHNASPLSTHETKMATPTGKWLILILQKNEGLWKSTFCLKLSKMWSKFEDKL